MHPVTQAGYGVAPCNQQIPKTYKPQPARKVPVVEDFEPVKTGPVIRVTTIWSFRDRRAAERFFQRLLRREGKEPLRIITDRLKSYGAALRTMLPHVADDTGRYANNRAEVSHQHTRQREQKMRRFKSRQQAQRFLSVHGLVQNLFRVGRHLLRSSNYRLLRSRSFTVGDR